jgi:GTP-binding protein HflX
VAAFRATLEEIAEADLLLHVVDVTHPHALSQAEAVHATLADIDADEISVLPVLNKIDRLSNPGQAQQSLESFPGAVAISALRGDGINDLLEAIQNKLFESFETITVELPYSEGGLISLFHEEGQVDLIENKYEGVFIQGRMPIRYLTRYKKFIVDGLVPQ